MKGVGEVGVDIVNFAQALAKLKKAKEEQKDCYLNKDEVQGLMYGISLLKEGRPDE